MQTFNQLSALVHLTELELGYVDIDLATIQPNLLQPMPRVRKFSIWCPNLGGPNFTTGLCRLIFTIFPAVEVLGLVFHLMVTKK